jgi:hypothetical protein
MMLHAVTERAADVPPDALRSEKLTPWHRDRLAVVYVRQSTPQQVLLHQESTRLQYGLVERAVAWGWPRERILVIDDDLGRSGTTAEGRTGFQHLVSEVSLDDVGLILGIEMSRLARSNKDWQQLLEVCALFRTVIADLDGVYDPSQYNDRLLLGLKRPASYCTSCCTYTSLLRWLCASLDTGGCAGVPPFSTPAGGSCFPRYRFWTRPPCRQ